MNRFLIPALLGAIGAPATAFGAGFQVNEQSARATGKGNAVIATTKDASSIWHNPAGLAHVKGTSFQAGVSAILPDNDYVGPGFPSTNPGGEDVTATLNSSPAFVPHFYAAQALSDRAVVGLGFYASYGLGTSWEDPGNWVGRTQAETTELRALFFTPTVALKPTEWLNVAVGLQLVPATLDLDQTLGGADGNVLFPRANPNELDGRFRIAASAFGVGATAGFQIEATKNLHFGFVYRSAVDLSFEGDIDFSLPSNVPTEVAASFPDQGGSGDVTIPHTFGWGIGWVEDTWNVEFATQLTLWDSFQALTINFDEGLPSPSTTEPRNWEVAPMFRLGGEVRFGDLATRLGVVYDVSPVPDETVEPGLPDGNRFNVSAGLGYTFGAFTIDAAYLAVILEGRSLDDTIIPSPDTPFEGRFEGGVVHVIATSVGVDF